jgi:hypothetical protein
MKKSRSNKSRYTAAYNVHDFKVIRIEIDFKGGLKIVKWTIL